MYDYLVVGSGLYGAAFAHEAKKRESLSLLLIKETILLVMFIQRRLKESISTNMACIYKLYDKVGLEFATAFSHNGFYFVETKNIIKSSSSYCI